MPGRSSIRSKTATSIYVYFYFECKRMHRGPQFLQICKEKKYFLKMC
jgi:hypothetical protein